MNHPKSEELILGLTTAFIDQSNNSNLAYRPEFVYNDHKQGKKVLVSLEQEWEYPKVCVNLQTDVR